MVDSHTRIDPEGLGRYDNGNGVFAKIHRGLASIHISCQDRVSYNTKISPGDTKSDRALKH